MNKTVWSNLHEDYKGRDWIDKPSLFAETAVQYFPESGSILELGAGQAQDSRYFADCGYMVTSTDIEQSAQDIAKSKLTSVQRERISFETVDLRQELPYAAESFDVVYAHLSLHYFDYQTTLRLFGEIKRVLKPGGTFAFFTNSVHDPEHNTGTKIEEDYFQIGDATKRYFSVETTREFTKYFETNLLDDLGETYKDQDKGVHNLIRFVGKRPLSQKTFHMAIPYTAAIVQRDNNGVREVLLQTRWKPQADPVYSGTFEFPAGVLDKPFEDVYETVSREVQEETGLQLKTIIGDNRTKIYRPNGDDAAFAFRPFCCTQQLQNGKPWIGFVFVCEVEPGEPVAQLSEAKDVRWVPAVEVRAMIRDSPEKFFTLELPAWEYYFASANETDDVSKHTASA